MGVASDIAERPQKRSELSATELDGEIIIYDERTQHLHHLNPSASIVFELCDGTTTRDEMAREIARAFSVDEENVRDQLRILLTQLSDAGLLEEQ